MFYLFSIEGPLANVFFLLATFSPVVMKIPPLSLYNKMLVREIEDTIGKFCILLNSFGVISKSQDI